MEIAENGKCRRAFGHTRIAFSNLQETIDAHDEDSTHSSQHGRGAAWDIMRGR